MKIEKSTYEGYLWYSDMTEPKILEDEEFELKMANDKNPFVVEGQLFDADRMISISIKYVDGEYICNSYKVDSLDFNRTDVEKKEFHSNRMKGYKLQFLQYWIDKEDDLCEGMNVLCPSKLVFVGLLKNKENEKL